MLKCEVYVFYALLLFLIILFGCNQLFGGTGLLHFVQFEFSSATNDTTVNTILKNCSKNKITEMFKKAILTGCVFAGSCSCLSEIKKTVACEHCCGPVKLFFGGALPAWSPKQSPGLPYLVNIPSLKQTSNQLMDPILDQGSFPITNYCIDRQSQPQCGLTDLTARQDVLQIQTRQEK